MNIFRNCTVVSKSMSTKRKVWDGEAEYQALLEAFACKGVVTCKILKETKSRYKRYLKGIIFDNSSIFIKHMIVEFLEVEPSCSTKNELSKKMKDIDMALVMELERLELEKISV